MTAEELLNIDKQKEVDKELERFRTHYRVGIRDIQEMNNLTKNSRTERELNNLGHDELTDGFLKDE